MRDKYPNPPVKQWRLAQIEPGVMLMADSYHWPATSHPGLFAMDGPNSHDPTLATGDFSITGVGPMGRMSFLVTKRECAPDTYARLRQAFDEMCAHNSNNHSGLSTDSQGREAPCRDARGADA